MNRYVFIGSVEKREFCLMALFEMNVNLEKVFITSKGYKMKLRVLKKTP